LGLESEVAASPSYVRFTLRSGAIADVADGPFSDSCAAANSVLFGNLVSAAKQSDWESEAERFGGLEIEGQLNFCHRCTGRSAGLSPLRIQPGI